MAEITKQVTMDVEDIVSKALRELEILDSEEYNELRKDIVKYEELRSLARKVAEEDRRVTEAVNDKIESGDEEGIKTEIAKICSPKKLKMIKESLEAETFHLYIAKIDGTDTVKIMKNGKELFPTIQIESVSDVDYADALQWASILIEIAILAGDCVGVHLHISASRMKSVAEGVSKLVTQPAMRRAIQAFLNDWKANAKALARAHAIFTLLRASYSARILVNTFKLICQDMSVADWARTLAVLTASLFAAFATGGAALIAKIVLALNSAYSLAKKITNVEHLTYIKTKMEVQDSGIFFQ